MIKDCSRIQPCPICGKPDWCGTIVSEKGDFKLCQRSTDEYVAGESQVLGADGMCYIFVRKSNAGANIFEEAGQRLARQRLYKGEHLGNLEMAKINRKVLTPVDIVDPLSNRELDAIYRDLLSMLYLEERHSFKLREDGWTEELIKANHIVSFPEEDYVRFQNRDKIHSRQLWRKTLAEKLVEKYGDLTGVPGAYINAKGIWTFTGKPGILFPLYDEHGYIYRLRVRLDNPIPGKGKYRNFSSWYEDEEAATQGFLKNKFAHGCQADNHLGFYINSARDDMYIAYITEGEKKGIIGEYLLKAPVISVPGVNSYSKLLVGDIGFRPIDALARMGIKMFIIAFDADKHTNEKVMKSQWDTVNSLKKEGFAIGLAEWDASLGKGLDDLLVGGCKPRYVLA